jgi:hypothetical protein
MHFIDETMKIKLKPGSILGLITILLASCSLNKTPDVAIVYDATATPVQLLAAREINRYIYIRTSNLPSLSSADSMPAKIKNVIFIGTQKQYLENQNFSGFLKLNDTTTLKEEQYIIKRETLKGRNFLIIIGGGDYGCLYGAYRLAEIFGMRFYLHGDVVPDKQIAFEMPHVDIHGRPLFELRGIQPFHDFPEGPDWWNLNEYKSILTQLPKMGMNFFGLHTYPEGGPNAEPTVWIGPKSEIGENGKVLKSYPSSYQSTYRGNWGYAPEKTSDYHFGADLLFETDKYAASVMDGMIPSPDSTELCNELFNRTGDMFRNAFSFGRYLGIRTCVGTETPLAIPKNVRDRLLKNKKDATDPAFVAGLYEGIFERIKKAYPVDYYWLWTPESWTWDSVPASIVKRTENDLLIAVKAAKTVKAPFTLATCGWVLGPPGKRGLFDKRLPKDMPFSCINRYVGFAPVEKAFEGITGRPKWAIPWMEDDPGLIYPQLWAGRMRRDAMDALKYGCNGLLGIHWRTQIIGPNVSALAKAGWDQGNWKELNISDSLRDIPVKDFYEDWAKSQFGEEVAKPIAEIFETIDGCQLYKPEKKKDYEAFLYRPITWIDGPGGIKINKEDWKIIEKKYAFLNDYEALGRILKGPGNRERYDYWLNYFRYSKTIAHLGCILGLLDSVIHNSEKTTNQSEKAKIINEVAIPLRSEASKLWGELETSLLSVITTSGEIGTITNLEQHNLVQLKLLNKYDNLLMTISGKPLPANITLSHTYQGIERIFIPAYRSLLEKDEDLNLKIIILSNDKAATAKLHWRKMGMGKYSDLNIENVSRAVYSVQIPVSVINSEDFEYYITARMPSGKTLIYPPTAPEINNTVIVLSEKTE